MQRGFFFLFGNIATIDNDHMVVGIDANAAELPGDPSFRQRLGPVGIDFESGRITVGMRWL